ncbi:MAG TPA: FKBP-type peptidyl-prolyl cis-trans isomerase [Amoebophilaceae bacterium]|jgi:FKBP-type peptidyl-prolyl cis-trans isomerase|nr:FKBP-type peptidyl-prolyl cis-trans isomerase [Amoebophilaceae bacterium]
MKRKIIYAFLLVFAIGAGYYNHWYTRYFYALPRTASGIAYKTITTGNGKKAQPGEWVQLSLTIKVRPNTNEKDIKNKKETILFCSLNEAQPYLIKIGNKMKTNAKLVEMLGMMEEKKHMVFMCSSKVYMSEVPADQLEETLKNMGLNEDDELIVDIKIERVMTEIEQEHLIEAQRKEQAMKDRRLIQAYLTKHGITATETPSGLFYVVDRVSKGGKPICPKNVVKIHYIGKLLDGTVFDTSLKEVAKEHGIYHPQKPYQPIKFQVGSGSVIPGWEEGALLLKINEKARWFIPSGLGYGNQAAGPLIPANTVLIFDIEVVDVCD